MRLNLKKSILLTLALLTPPLLAASEGHHKKPAYYNRLGELLRMPHGVGSGGFGESFEPTPKNPLGPFFPTDALDPAKEKDRNLIEFEGKTASGVPIHVQGVVTDLQGNPIGGASIEIWQACETGKYNHEADTNPAKIDPNFQYYGLAVTPETGLYSFESIIPGAYEASPNWTRPSHIHYLIRAEGYESLVTQLYFDPSSFEEDEVICYERKKEVKRDYLDALNKKEHHLKKLSEADQKRLLTKFSRFKVVGKDPVSGKNLTFISRIGTFNIRLKKEVSVAPQPAPRSRL